MDSQEDQRVARRVCPMRRTHILPEHARASRGHNLALARVSVASAAINPDDSGEHKFPDHPIPAIPTTEVRV
jgi:hypothetical protein